MWTNLQFWKDSTWRAFRTFCQTLAALLAATYSGLLATTGSGEIPSTPWWGFLYASGIAGLISLLQSVDRERAVGWTGYTKASDTTVVPAKPVDAAVVIPATVAASEVVAVTGGSSNPASANYQP